jgi:multiple sugar transport system substrate-binding protein
MISFRHLGILVLAGGLLIPSAGLQQARAAAPVTVTIWTGAWVAPVGPTPIAAGIRAVIARYQQLHPNIKIDWTAYTPQQDPSTYQTLLTAISGGKAPDIAMIDRFLTAEFAAEGAVEPITPYLPKNAATLATDKHLPGAWSELHGFNGSLYGVPVIYDNVGFWALYYNKTLLQAAGITTPPTTWAQLNADAKQATKKAGSRITTLGYMPYTDTAGELDNFLYGEQGHLISSDGKTAKLNNPVAVKALGEEVAVIDAEGGWSQVARWIPPSTAPASQNPFFMQTAAMTDGGDWYLQDIALYAPKMQFGIVPLPNPAGKDYGAWAGGWSFQLVKGAAHPTEATAFMDYLTSPDGAKTFIQAAQSYGAAHHQVVVLPGALYFAYPGLVQQYNLPLLKTKYPEIYNGIQFFLNSPKTYAATFARDRNVVPGELWQAEQNAAQAALFHKMSPAAALAQQNTIIQKDINSFMK